MTEIHIKPVPKPRMTQSDRWRKRPAVVRYHAYCDDLRDIWGDDPVPDELSLVFYLPMPNSWSEKKRMSMDGQPHQQKPDIDNLAKAFMDALCEDDKYIHSLYVAKKWGRTGKIVVQDIQA